MLLMLLFLLRTDGADYSGKDGRRDLAGMVGAIAGLLLSALGQAAMFLVVPRYLGHTPWTQWGAGPVVLLVVAGSPVVIGSIIMVASLQKMRKRAS